MKATMSAPESPPIAAERYLKTDFLKALAHAMRSPLSVIGGSLAELEGASPEEREVYAKMASRNVSHLARLASQLESLAELELGNVPHNPVAVSARTLVESALKLTPPAKVEVMIEEQDSSALVRGDPACLARALAAPLENAQRFAREKVVVVIDCSHAEHILFHIDDDGPGFPEGSLPLIADRYRSARTRKARSDLALGLSMARSYAELNGGSLDLGTSPQGGARCTIAIPRSR